MNISRRKRNWMIGIFTLIIILTTSLLLVFLFDVGNFNDQPKNLVDIEADGESTNSALEEKEVGNETISEVKDEQLKYIKVTDGCGPHFEEECLRVRTGPGPDYEVVSRLRNGMVLKVVEAVETNGQTWYKISFDEWLRYPERIEDDWYVSANYVEVFMNEGDKTIWDNEYSTSTKKRIEVDRSSQKLSAYDGDEIFMEITISTGLELTPTPRGSFEVFKKTPSRYMQGPLPGLVDQQYYDLPGVPWNLYFTEGGAVIHGAYWHDSFGIPYSHGCVNLKPDEAQKLYYWTDLGTRVIVKD